MTVKGNYTAKVWIIYGVTLADLIFNGIADHKAMERGPPWLPFVWLGVQFFIQLLNLTLFAMMLFDTYLFQVGLVGVLIQEFRGLLAGLTLYSAVYACYAGVKISLMQREKLGEDALWGSDLFTAWSMLQKLAALAYYVLILYYSSKLGQPVWYQKHHWVEKYSGIARGAYGSGAAGGGGAGAIGAGRQDGGVR